MNVAALPSRVRIQTGEKAQIVIRQVKVSVVFAEFDQ